MNLATNPAQYLFLKHIMNISQETGYDEGSVMLHWND